MPLHKLDCQASANLPPLSLQQKSELLARINNWTITDSSRLVKTFYFARYPQVIEFVNLVAEIAQKQDHHPEMLVQYSQCLITYHTHTVQGLTINDFICAAKIDQLLQQ